MAPKAGYATPVLHVGEMQRSLRFYTLLGFETIDTQGEDGRVGWARLHCEGGALMLLQAEAPSPAGAHGLMLYMYTQDLASLREHLLANGLEVSPISHPDYMRSGEATLRDPDGNLVLVGHWGRSEHEAWERHLAEKRRPQTT